MTNAYITNNGGKSVSVVDTVSDTVSTTITVGNGPTGSAVSPDGTKTYVSNTADGTVSVINNATNTVIGSPITVGSSPNGVAITPDGTKAYVANQNSNNVSVIDTASNSVIATVTVGTTPVGVAITPDGLRAYVTNNTSGTVSVISTATNTTIGSAITVGTAPNGVAITSNGGIAYVANSGSNSISVISTASNSVGGTITASIGNAPFGVAISPDTTKLYVTNNTDGTVSVISTATNSVIGSAITVGTKPTGVAFTPDGAKAYVANTNSGGAAPFTTSVIDVATATVIATITVGSGPYAFGQFIKPAPPQAQLVIPPQGRLTLSSTAPVMVADSTGATTVYYLPYQGSGIPIFDAVKFVNYLLGTAGISLALDSNSGHTGYQQSGKLFDLFAFLNNGVLTLGTGPAWTNDTTRSNAIAQLNGLWVNNAALTVRFGTNSGDTVSVSANQATYLGTMYATANGQTSMSFLPSALSGGTNNFLGVYNAYNRVLTRSVCRDSAASWNYGSATIRPANNNTNNRISFVDGLAQSSIDAMYGNNTGVTPAGSTAAQIGIGLDVTNAFSAGFISGGNSLANNASIITHYYGVPQLGFHFVQAVENNPSGTGTATFGNLTGTQNVGLFLALEM
jgi:YVTN family beta-propeller protein